jgi:A/G-specific adenine glycosylase
VTQVLLERRATDVSLMAGMYELPPLPLDAVEGREPLLRVRHSITNTNYYVQVFAPRGPQDRALRRAIPAAKADLHWIRTSRLPSLPLTGLARKILQRLDVMEIRPILLPEPEPEAASSSNRKKAGASRPASKLKTSPHPAGARE